MTQMGKPLDMQANSFQNVQMAPRQNTKDPNSNDLPAKEKERLLSRITGYKKKNELFVNGKEHNKMGKDEFMKLLTVQLKNQDPMDPMKQDKIAAELAQFSSLEQLTNLNEKFDNMNKNQNVEDKFYGASFLGKEVVTSGSTLKFEGEGSDADILFNLDKPASKVLVRIYDGKNNMVGEIWKENIGRGNQNFEWDGEQLDKSISAPGEFRTQVFAWDKFADPIDVQTKSVGTVESVFFENGETVLLVEGKKVFLRDVDSFHVPGKNQENAVNEQTNIKKTMPKPELIQQLASQLGRNGQNNAISNLPIANNEQAKVNLNRNNQLNGINAYKKQDAPSTGITSVYDE